MGDGRRKKGPWRDLVERLAEVDYPDWPVNGPRTLGWVCAFINRRGGGPMEHHQWILTPDGDVYLEEYSGRDAGIPAVRSAATRRSLPPGVFGPQTYRFKEDVSDAALSEVVVVAEEAVEDWWGLHGAGSTYDQLFRPVGLSSTKIHPRRR